MKNTGLFDRMVSMNEQVVSHVKGPLLLALSLRRCRNWWCTLHLQRGRHVPRPLSGFFMNLKSRIASVHKKF